MGWIYYLVPKVATKTVCPRFSTVHLMNISKIIASAYWMSQHLNCKCYLGGNISKYCLCITETIADVRTEDLYWTVTLSLFTVHCYHGLGPLNSGQPWPWRRAGRQVLWHPWHLEMVLTLMWQHAGDDMPGGNIGGQILHCLIVLFTRALSSEILMGSHGRRRCKVLSVYALTCE